MIPPHPRIRLATSIALAAAVVVAGCSSSKPPAAAAPTPEISHIPRPNPVCVAANDQKLGPDADLSGKLFFGYIDGEQKEMPLGQALSMAVSGHKIQPVWVCPSRAEWK